jgi:hypothetical protein
VMSADPSSTPRTLKITGVSLTSSIETVTAIVYFVVCPRRGNTAIVPRLDSFFIYTRKIARALQRK